MRNNGGPLDRCKDAGKVGAGLERWLSLAVFPEPVQLPALWSCSSQPPATP